MPLLRKAQIVPLLLVWLLFGACGGDAGHSPGTKKKEQAYLGHSPEARYVGMGTCRSCHEDIYSTFIRTGMGQSIAAATRSKSAADFTRAHVYDRHSNMHYSAFWLRDSLYMKEYRLGGADTLHSRTERVSYVIGSGQHTNSHLQSVNGYLQQMPMTYYTQKGRWDLPPGFEGGMNTRFSRKIGLECMSCHNAFPDFVLGSENKFRALPQGIDCERCHGPGSFHVEQRRSTEPVDTSRFIDYSIVNPAKLQVDRQFDICQRCHLQGNAVLKDGRSFFDFRPGQKLSEYISVFMPKYRNGEDSFIMASHAERLRMSQCFIQSLKNADPASLRPYKKALTCVTCHNPHVSVRETNPNVFNDACTNCHTNDQKLSALHSGLKKWDNCVSCHMPSSGSTDIPHVSVHDHFIRTPVSVENKKKIAEFLGLYSVNERHPDRLTIARAYLDQYEKFRQDPAFLDSAAKLLHVAGENRRTVNAWIQLFFIRRQYPEVIGLVTGLGEEACLNQIFTRKTYDNADAWAAYRVAEAYTHTRDHAAARKWYEKAVTLAPFNLDFRNKLGASYMTAQDLDAASEQYAFIMRENPGFVAAYSNMGYIRLLEGLYSEAKRILEQGRRLDPDNEALLLNLATSHIRLDEKREAVVILEHVLQVNPAHAGAAQALKVLKAQ